MNNSLQKYLFLRAFPHVDFKSEVRAPPVLCHRPTETEREHKALLKCHHCKGDRDS